MSSVRNFVLKSVTGGVALALSGCTHYFVVDKLDTFVVVNLSAEVGDVHECLRFEAISKILGESRSVPDNSAICDNPPKHISVGGVTEVHLRAVNSRDLRYPLEGKKLTMSVVDRD